MTERLRVQVSVISMTDYEVLHYDKDKLREACKYTKICTNTLCMERLQIYLYEPVFSN